MLLALDSREKSYRHELLPGYQGQRPPFPGDLTEQLDALAGARGGVRLRRREGARRSRPTTCSRAASSSELAAGGTAVVMTSDRDAYQLVSERSSVLVPSKGGKPPERVDEAGVRERYGVERLAGARADRAARRPVGRDPGRQGHRRESAADLLRRYGTLEGVIEHATELTPRQRGVGHERGGRAARLPAGRDDAPRPRRCPSCRTASSTPQRAAAWAETRGLGRARAAPARARLDAPDSACAPTRS